MQPQIFVPLTEVQEVDFARVSGMSQTFDMHVHLREGNLLDFSQIPQNEAYGLQQYMTKAGVALSGGPSQPVVTTAQPAAEEDGDSDSEEVRTCCLLSACAQPPVSLCNKYSCLPI